MAPIYRESEVQITAREQILVVTNNCTPLTCAARLYFPDFDHVLCSSVLSYSTQLYDSAELSISESQKFLNLLKKTSVMAQFFFTSRTQYFTQSLNFLLCLNTENIRN
jgi:hypothetical protein